MERTRIDYTFEGRAYYQRKLLIGQVRQLVEILQGVRLDFSNPAALVASLGDRLPRALAVVLTPDGAHPKDKDIEALAAELAYMLTPEDVMRVVDDFFSLNDPYSFLSRFAETARAVEERLRRRAEATGSMTSSPFSPEGTSPGAT